MFFLLVAFCVAGSSVNCLLDLFVLVIRDGREEDWTRSEEL